MLVWVLFVGCGLLFVASCCLCVARFVLNGVLCVGVLCVHAFCLAFCGCHILFVF